MTTDHSKPECIDPQIGALLVSYALGKLNDADAEAFEHHVLHCSACLAELEEATPALDTLTSTRESFVERASREDESFRSQYDRLKQKQHKLAKASATSKRSDWMEALWIAIWGRRWIVGTVGATALAFMFWIRTGPQVVSPPIARSDIESVQPKMLSMEKTSERDSSRVSQGQATGLKVDVTTEQSSISSLTKLREQSMSDEVPQSKLPAPVVKQKNFAPQVKDLVPLSMESSVAAPENEEIHQTAVSGRSESLVPDEPIVEKEAAASQPIDFAQVADLTLGRFNPEFYQQHRTQNSEGIRAGRAMEEKSLPDAKYSLIPQQTELSANDETIADSLFAGGNYREARDRFERMWQADSTNPKYPTMVGVASFALGEYSHAQGALIIADKILAPGTQKHDVELLLARIEILSGQLSDAKLLLQKCIEATGDPVRIQRIQRAISQIDSIQFARTPKQIPR